MDTEALSNPLIAPVPREVPLKAAPLLRVVAQVRFPLVASLERQEFIGPFQEAIRREYPALRPEQSVGAVIGPNGLVDTQPPSMTWRFHDISGVWRASLAPGFVALETTAYTSRDDFLGRFERLLQATEHHVDPQVIDRLGIRYIDQVPWTGSRDFGRLVRADVAGILTSPLGEMVKQALTENVFTLDDGSSELMARWGLVPPHSTIDPAAVEPSDSPSWILDLDAHQTGTQPFAVDLLMERARLFAERIYAFFRWVVTDDFLRECGGEPAPGTSSAPPVIPLAGGYVWSQASSSGQPLCMRSVPGGVDVTHLISRDAVEPVRKAVVELRRLSGLTWEQMARLLGVSRRSLHFWASGEAVSASHEERVQRLLTVMRKVDRGSAAENRGLLLQASSDGSLPFDTLAAGRFEEALEHMGVGAERQPPMRMALSSKEERARRPLPPEQLVDALHDRVHGEVQGVRPARARRVEK